MKKPISATIEEDLIEWISKEIEQSNLYRNKSHLIEAALELLRQKIEKDNTELTTQNPKLKRTSGRVGGTISQVKNSRPQAQNSSRGIR